MQVSAACDLALKTVSNFSQSWFTSSESRRTPAEWMIPAMFGVHALTHSSIESRELTSHLACSTETPSFAANFSTSRQIAGSETFSERERNLIDSPGALWTFFATSFLSSHWPINRPSAPLPPEMRMTPLVGTSNSRLRTSYAVVMMWRNT